MKDERESFSAPESAGSTAASQGVGIVQTEDFGGFFRSCAVNLLEIDRLPLQLA